MAALDHFSPPANLTELSQAGREGWSSRVADAFDMVTGHFPQFIDPLFDDLGPGAAVHSFVWPAFPAELRRSHRTDFGRWRAADRDRQEQDEYCEWSVLRDDQDEVLRVSFTTEVPEYYEQLLETDEALLLDLYQQFLGHPVNLDDLRRAGGTYDPANKWNRSTDGDIIHLKQTNNNLGAAVRLAAEATVQRVDENGNSVTDQQALVRCGGLGSPFRNSDPQIAAAVNQLAASGDEVTLADPPGLYIASLITAGLETPDGTDAAEFWTVDRGEGELGLRGRFEVPAELPYNVSAIKIGGRPIRFGAQLADRLSVRIRAASNPADHQPAPEPCVA